MKKRILSLLLVFALALSLAPAALAAEPIRVAVIDTGVSTTVVAPANRAAGKNYILPGQSTEDQHGHGTAIASIIVGSEEAAIRGYCPEAVIVPLVWASRDDDGNLVQGKADMAGRAIHEAIDVYGCRIINLSAGSANNDPALWEAVDYAEEKGVLLLSSAGNDGTDKYYYPGASRTVLCVGSCNKEGTARSRFSNSHDRVDLLAVGENLRVASLRQGASTLVSGTSFSTAIVSGVAAQLWTQNPDLTLDELREVLLTSDRTVEGCPVFDPQAVLARSAEKAKSRFSDVAESSPFYNGIYWAVEKGITKGVTTTTFAHRQTCSQAHILTFLWRAMGKPQSAVEGVFVHPAVQESAYFYEAFCWAWAAGLITDPGIDPHAPCSRADVVTYLWKLAGSPTSISSAFADVSADASYAQAVSWAVRQGITQGVTATQFQPTAACNRGQIVTFLYRAYH